MQNKILFAALTLAITLCACTPEPNVAIRIDCGDLNNKGINTTVNGKPIGECPVDIMVHAGQTIVDAKGENKDSTFYAKTELTLAENSMKRINLSIEGTYKESYYAERAVDIPGMEAYLQHYPQGAKAAEIKTALAEAKAALAKLAPGLEMVVIPAGSFQMGDLSGKGSDYEKPVHKVTLKSFAMSKTEITFAQYDAYAEAAGVAKPKDKGWGRANRPVINVSWNEAVAYAKWLSQQTGKKYRLPTEAEWEYAARAGTSTEYSWGNEIDCSQASYDGGEASKCYYTKANGDYRGTAPVGSYKPNNFGLVDMHGNVWEWVQDCDQSYNGASVDGNAVTSGKCESRVLRGGSWFDGPNLLRSAYRSGRTPTDRSAGYGFRLVQDN
jgi:formylglycine-generating enzyme required for sulfatase activity